MVSDSDIDQSARLQKHLELVRRWNTSCGLVSRNDIERLEALHVRDSLDLVPYVSDAQHLVDIGSGGGFPGTVLAIALPNLQVTCVERSHKKCRFLRHVKITLALNNLNVEEVDIRDAHAIRETYEVATIRAVAPPADAWAMAKLTLSQHGRALLQTSQAIDQPLKDGVIESAARATRGWISVVQRAGSTQ